MTFDPDALTPFQRLLLKRYPGIRFTGDITRAEAVAAGIDADERLKTLLKALGPACASVFDAARILTSSAEESLATVRRLRDDRAPTDTVIREALIAGALRRTAADVWRIKDRANAAPSAR